MAANHQHYDTSSSDDDEDDEDFSGDDAGAKNKSASSAAGRKKKATHARVSKACIHCKVGRRKCSGTSPCDYCVKRGVECVYDDLPQKKRGPKGGLRQQVLEEENAKLRLELVQLRKQTAQLAVAPSPAAAGTPAVAADTLSADTLLPAGVWGVPGPIIPTPNEVHLLRAFFTFSNRALPAVDEEYFNAALEAARYGSEGGGGEMQQQNRQRGGRGRGAAVAASSATAVTSGTSKSTSIHAVARNSGELAGV